MRSRTHLITTDPMRPPDVILPDQFVAGTPLTPLGSFLRRQKRDAAEQQKKHRRAEPHVFFEALLDPLRSDSKDRDYVKEDTDCYNRGQQLYRYAISRKKRETRRTLLVPIAKLAISFGSLGQRQPIYCRAIRRLRIALTSERY